MKRVVREVAEISEHQLGPTFPAGCFSASNQGSRGPQEFQLPPFRLCPQWELSYYTLRESTCP